MAVGVSTDSPESHHTCNSAAGGTRTCIHTPAAPLEVDDVSPSLIEGALHGAALVYFDGRLAEAALQVAKAATAAGIPVLVEAERLRPGLNELLAHADYVVTSAKFPQVMSECYGMLVSVGNAS